ncbi:MAG: hypothetical protein ABSE45_14895 [Candidatus Acidiferrales bacterium]
MKKHYKVLKVPAAEAAITLEATLNGCAEHGYTLKFASVYCTSAMATWTMVTVTDTHFLVILEREETAAAAA